MCALTGTAAALSSVFASAGPVATAASAVSAGVGIAGAVGAFGNKRPVMPPSPMISQASVDQSAEEAQQQAKQRQAIAGGINSTVGTAGGQAGAILNPSTMGQKTLLGA